MLEHTAPAANGEFLAENEAKEAAAVSRVSTETDERREESETQREDDVTAGGQKNDAAEQAGSVGDSNLGDDA